MEGQAKEAGHSGHNQNQGEKGKPKYIKRDEEEGKIIVTNI